MIITIATEDKDRFPTKVEILQKKASKLGLEPFVVSGLDDIIHDTVDVNGKLYPVSYYRVTVEGTEEALRFEGWKVLAQMKRRKGGMIITPFVNVDDLNLHDTHGQNQSYCDHCKTNRQRNKVYILRHEDGTMMQVGSTCMKDFTSNSSVLSILSLQDMYQSILDMEFDEEYFVHSIAGGQSLNFSFANLHDFLCAVLYSIKVSGWVSRSQDYHASTATCA